MKKFLCFFVIILCFVSVNSQERGEISVDSMLVNIDKSTFTSNILYDRVLGIGDLNAFSDTIKIARHPFFKQALFELYLASKKEKFMPIKNLEQYCVPDSLRNEVDIGIINASFHEVNYDPVTVENGALDIRDGLFVQINDNPPFLSNHTFIASPLKSHVAGKNVVFHFKPNLLLQSTERKNIVTLTALFEKGKSFTIIEDGIIVLDKIEIPYSESGIKTIEFKAVFEDDSILITEGALDFSFSEVITPLGIKNGSVTASLPFKGYGANDPLIHGYLDYRVFYHYENGAVVPILKKPIIIIDGFDPGDKRQIEDSDPHPGQTNEEHVSIAEMMTYIDNSNVKHFLIKELRELGYDVVIVNHPNYTRNGIEIDGGADYIERNALTHVQLYQELNAELTQNNSQEQLVIIGPSMGGQISRYALAYMEEHNIPHNTRLWVSVDSPHLGANIPIGTQTMLHLLKDYGNSSEAKEFIDDELGSAAAKQQLIEQYKDRIGDQVGQEWLNAKTISQNYNENRGHPFFQQYYNNLYNNGLSGSNGYPQNLRKIAIVNGSLKNVKNFKNPYQPLGTGFTPPYNDAFPADGAQTFKMRGKANVLGHIVTMENYFLPSIGTNHKIAYFKKWSFNWSYYDRFITNNNSRGNLDNLPGGWYPTQRDLAYTVEGSTPCEWFIGQVCVNNWYIDNIKHVNSFIPTVSALGIYNPDFNWAHTFDRNLVCTGEIPFDNYFGPKENEQHVYFTEKSVAWLLAELDENPQPPTIYLDENNMSGPSFICSSDTATYSFGNCESAPVFEWEVSNNLQIVISPAQNHSVKVKPKNTSSNGLAFIKAIFDNPNEPVKKNIWIGKPNYNFDLQWDEVSRRLNITIVDDNLDLQEITNVNWEVIGSTNGGIIQNCSGFECHARGPLHNIWTVDLKVTVSNSCGTTIEYLTATPPPPIAKSDPIYYEFIGQGDNIYTVNLVEDHISNPINRQQNFPEDLKIFVYDFTGNLVQQTQEEIIDISSLKSGFYIFKVYIDREILTKKVVKI